MFNTSIIKKTLLAVSTAATLFVALPSQADDRYYDHSPSRDYHWQGGYDHGRYDHRGYDRRWHDRYAYYRHRDEWRYRHDARYRHEWDRRWR